MLDASEFELVDNSECIVEFKFDSLITLDNSTLLELNRETVLVAIRMDESEEDIPMEMEDIFFKYGTMETLDVKEVVVEMDSVIFGALKTDSVVFAEIEVDSVRLSTLEVEIIVSSGVDVDTALVESVEKTDNVTDEVDISG